MLSKLWKQDMRATSRLFLPAILIFLIIMGLNKITMEISFVRHIDNTFLNILAGIFISLYGLAMFSLIILTYVFIIIHFYRTMVTNQGYLTHTLPVKKSSILTVKLLNAFFWQAAVILVILASIFFLSLGHWNLSLIQDLLSEIRVMLIDNPWVTSTTASIAAAIIITMFLKPLEFYAAISIGQLSNNHKVFASIAAYIGIYVVLEIIQFSGSFFVISFFENRDITEHFLAQLSGIYSVYNLALILFFYVISNYFLSRRLNLG